MQLIAKVLHNIAYLRKTTVAGTLGLTPLGAKSHAGGVAALILNTEAVPMAVAGVNRVCFRLPHAVQHAPGTDLRRVCQTCTTLS